tara:strand:+ start:404 stop:724 length:321 start_codon:yes stop_codon:yes gene_type:complete
MTAKASTMCTYSLDSIALSPAQVIHKNNTVITIKSKVVCVYSKFQAPVHIRNDTHPLLEKNDDAIASIKISTPSLKGVSISISHHFQIVKEQVQILKIWRLLQPNE